MRAFSPPWRWSGGGGGGAAPCRVRAPLLALNAGPAAARAASRELSGTPGRGQQGRQPAQPAPASGARAQPAAAASAGSRPAASPGPFTRVGVGSGPLASAPAQAFVQRLFGQQAASGQGTPIFGRAPTPFVAPKQASSAPPAVAAVPARQGAPAATSTRQQPAALSRPLTPPASPGPQRPAAAGATAAPRVNTAQQLWNVVPGQLAQQRQQPLAAQGAAAPAAAPAASAAAPPAALAPAAQTTVDHFRRMREAFAAMREQAAKSAQEQRARVQQPPVVSGRRGGGPEVAAKPSYRDQVQAMKARSSKRQLNFKGGATTPSGKAPRSVKGMFRVVAYAARSSAVYAATRRAAHLARVVVITDELTPRQLAKAMGLTPARIMARIADLGVRDARIDGEMDPEVAEILVLDEGQHVKREDSKRRDRVRTAPLTSEEAAAKGYPHRAPVVAVMGHVDHGKTTLLDALRGTNVAEREAGGITQGVAAFSVPMRADVTGTGDRRAPGGKGSKSELAKAAATARVTAAASKGAVAAAGSKPAASAAASNVDVMTFLDTPGHALFASMRRRGTAVTDVVVLVVDGRDGVMPQTRECVSIILEAAVPCVVAVTKCDALTDSGKAVASVAKQLLEVGLVTEGYNGDSPILPISAKSGAGLAELKEAISLQAELLDLRAPVGADTQGEATVVDSRALKGSGTCVDVIVRWGTLRVGDVVVAGEECGRIKALQTDAVGAASVNRRLLEGPGGGGGGSAGKAKSGAAPSADASSALTSVTEAPPGTPVRVLGLRGMPPPGCDLLVVESEERAKAVVDGRVRKRQASEAAAVAAADAITRAAEQKAYNEKRQLRLAFEAANTRERKRTALKRAGMPVPPNLVAEPWEIAVLAQGASGKIAGVGSAKRTSMQGAQQSEVSMTFAQAQAGADAAEAADGSAESSPAAPAGPKQVAFIVKTDTGGALAAVGDALARVPAFTTEVTPRVVHTGVGEVTERDVELAGDMGAHIVAFNAKVPPNVAKAAERRKVRLISGRVIYHVLDEVCELLSEHMAPTMTEEVAAVAEVKQVFTVNAKRSDGDGGTAVAGCVIVEGTFFKAGMTCFRVMRGDALVGEARELASLMHLKDRVESVKKGTECGMALEGVSDYAQGDRILAIKRKSLKAKLAVRYD